MGTAFSHSHWIMKFSHWVMNLQPHMIQQNSFPKYLSWTVQDSILQSNQQPFLHSSCYITVFSSHFLFLSTASLQVPHLNSYFQHIDHLVNFTLLNSQISIHPGLSSVINDQFQSLVVNSSAIFCNKCWRSMIVNSYRRLRIVSNQFIAQ